MEGVERQIEFPVSLCHKRGGVPTWKSLTQSLAMDDPPLLCRGSHFPSAVIAHAMCLYLSLPLSFRRLDEMLAERSLRISYETLRRWVASLTTAMLRSCLGARSAGVAPGIWMSGRSGEPSMSTALRSTCSSQEHSIAFHLDDAAEPTQQAARHTDARLRTLARCCREPDTSAQVSLRLCPPMNATG